MTRRHGFAVVLAVVGYFAINYIGGQVIAWNMARDCDKERIHSRKPTANTRSKTL